MANPFPSRERPIVSASDVGTYAFCARAFWLGRVQGVPSRNVAVMAQGAAAHKVHGRGVVRYQSLQRAGFAFIGLAGILLVIAVLAQLLFGG